MGFDLYGRAPTAASGRYFRNNVWWWRPMQALIYLSCFDILTEDELLKLGFNECYSYTAEQAEAIASCLSDILADEKQLAEYKKKAMSVLPEVYQGCWSKQNVVEFVAFLKHSGGFEVF